MSERVVARRMRRGRGFGHRIVWALLLPLFGGCGDGRDRQWREPQRLSPVMETDAIAPEVAIDPVGNATVVWSQRDGTGLTRLWASRRTARRWGAAEVVDVPFTGHAPDVQNARVAMDAKGDAVTVWTKSDGTNSIWAARQPATGTWTEAVRLSPPSTAGSFPGVAVDPAGNGFAIWPAQFYEPGQALPIWTSRLASGRWEPAQGIQAGRSTVSGGGASVAMAADGTAIAVWHEQRGPAFRIWANRFRPGIGWGTAEPISPEEPTEGALLPAVAVDGLGNATAAWTRHTDELFKWDVVGSRYDVGRGWSPSVVIAPARTWVDAVQIGVDSLGGALAIWWDASDRDVFRVWGSRFTKGGGWGDAQRLQAASSSPALGPPHLAVAAEGSAIALWRERADGRFTIWAARFEPRRGWGPPESIGSAPTPGGDLSSVGPPVLAMNAVGDAVAAWSEPDGGHAVIRSRAFETAGP